MAKKKLTIEDVLVPREEIPYEVPKNWCWVKLGGLVNEVKNGTTIKQNKDGIGPKVTRIESVQNNNIDFNRIGYITEQEKIKDSDWYEAGDIALSHINSIEHVGKTALIEEQYLPLIHGMNLLRIRLKKELINPRYFAIYTQGYDFKSEVVDRVNRAVNQVSLNQKRLNEIPIAVPPLAEQVRIVNRIESLFDKVDRAAGLVEEARDGFEKRRAAILAKCLRGEFTQSIELVNINDSKAVEGFYKIPSNWKWIRLKDLCEKITDGTHKSPKSYEEGKYKYITAKNIKEWGIDLGNITYLTEEDHNVIYNRCDVRKGDVLYIKDGATTGIATINDLEEEFSLLSSVALLRVNNVLDNRYLKYVLNSYEIKKNILDSVKGVAITRLTLKKINDIVIPVPPINEQKKIVDILDKIIEEENEIDALSNINQIVENIKKAILAKAFRGNIESNDSDEESSIELLKNLI